MSRTRFRVNPRVNPHSIECGFTLKRVRDMIRTYSRVEVVFKEKLEITIETHSNIKYLCDRVI